MKLVVWAKVTGERSNRAPKSQHPGGERHVRGWMETAREKPGGRGRKPEDRETKVRGRNEQLLWETQLEENESCPLLGNLEARCAQSQRN